jgi:hypothetical protein
MKGVQHRVPMLDLVLMQVSVLILAAEMEVVETEVVEMAAEAPQVPLEPETEKGPGE